MLLTIALAGRTQMNKRPPRPIDCIVFSARLAFIGDMSEYLHQNPDELGTAVVINYFALQNTG